MSAAAFATATGNYLGAFVLGELFNALVRQSGRVTTLPHASSPGVAVAGPDAHILRRELGLEDMSFDLVGFDDDDMGSIGYDELIGADDFLDALVQGSAADLLISGDGSSEIIGAANGAARKKAVAAKRAAALKALAMKNAGAVVSRGLDRRRRYPLGFVPTAIAAATSVQVPSAPQNLFRPERLVIPSDIAFDSGVADIKVGNQSQLVQSVEVPAALFSEVAINTGVTFDTAEVGNQVSVTIRNKSAAAFEFTAGLVGTIAK